MSDTQPAGAIRIAVRHHGWGIWWLLMLAVNSAFCGADLITGRYWFAFWAAIAAAASAVMAYRDLTGIAAYSTRGEP